MQRTATPVIRLSIFGMLMIIFLMSGNAQDPVKRAAPAKSPQDTVKRTTSGRPAQDTIKRTAPGRTLNVERSWPKEIKYASGRILMYQLQPDSLIGNKLYARAVIQLAKTASTPVFGTIWVTTTISSDRGTGEVILLNTKVLKTRLSGQDSLSKDRVNQVKSLLEKEIPKWEIPTTLNELTATLKESSPLIKQSLNFDNTPPEIIFLTKPAILVLFDGTPSFKAIDQSGLQLAVNTPFLIIKDPNGKLFYLYGGTTWFRTYDVLKGIWSPTQETPAEIIKLQKELQDKGTIGTPQKSLTKQDESKEKQVIPQIIVRTKPAELLQSNGEPAFSPIEGTKLLYMTNTGNNIFMSSGKQIYYILISGRWYTATAMKGPWTYVAANKLPPDFVKIPEGSAKDIVLASVAGTDAAKEAVMDAQIPQTALVDRKTATCAVKYDGNPKFEQIKGTLLFRAVSTSSMVLMLNNTYYVCDNAVWFTGGSPNGPWAVAAEIPVEIRKIPPEDPAYYVTFVDIYEVEPLVVYTGYLPGYTGCYVYGPTVVYGTGYQYSGWNGQNYYPRPVTWGFNMNYNPWTNWSMDFGFSSGCLQKSVNSLSNNGGWWGPPMYRPPYAMHYNHYYGKGPIFAQKTNVNINASSSNRNNFNQNNIYSNHGQGIKPVTQPLGKQPENQGTRLATQPSTQPATRENAGNTPAAKDVQTGKVNRASPAKDAMNNVFADKQGNVYRKENGTWQQNDGKKWQNADITIPSSQQSTKITPSMQPAEIKQSTPPRQPTGFDRYQMDQQSKQRDRGQQRQANTNNFQRITAGSGGSVGRPADVGGGAVGGRP